MADLNKHELWEIAVKTAGTEQVGWNDMSAIVIRTPVELVEVLEAIAARSAISTNVVPAQGEHSGRVAVSNAARDVLAERQRQISAEGWTPEHDDEHADGQMAVAAGYYALSCGYPHERDIGRGHVPTCWPWAPSWWKPRSNRENLIRAGALVLAEIERIDRAAAHKAQQERGQ